MLNQRIGNILIFRTRWDIEILVVFGKANISDPDGFKDKIRAMERAARSGGGLKRANSSSSFRSMFSKSQRTVATTSNGSKSEQDDEEN